MGPARQAVPDRGQLEKHAQFGASSTPHHYCTSSAASDRSCQWQCQRGPLESAAAAPATALRPRSPRALPSSQRGVGVTKPRCSPAARRRVVSRAEAVRERHVPCAGEETPLRRRRAPRRLRRAHGVRSSRALRAEGGLLHSKGALLRSEASCVRLRRARCHACATRASVLVQRRRRRGTRRRLRARRGDPDCVIVMNG